MSKHDNPLPDHERIRLGRLVFDGADRLQIANRLGLSTDDVDDAWFFCRQQLSRHFADPAGVAYRLLDDQELKKRSLDCLRLLLDWRESLLLQQRFNGLETVERDEPGDEARVEDRPRTD